MMEDFNRLIELLLPTLFRKPRLLELLRELVATPLQSRFSEFNLFASVSDYDATVTPQVCSLAAAVERRFDCACEITELTGKPYDFLVTIDRSTDLQAIKEFIDAHKLAGKSFVFELGDTAFTAVWSNHVDEDLIELYSAEWIDHVNEDDGKVTINVSVLLDVDSQWYVVLQADAPVASNLNVYVTVNYRTVDMLLAHAGSKNVALPLGSTQVQDPITLIVESEGRPLELFASVTPSSDDIYTYIINAINNPNT